MDSALKVTDQPQEAAFEDVVAGDNVVNIPLFQRAYRWGERNLSEFFDDIQEIVEGRASSQFLGVLVMVSQVRQIGRPAVYDVVDGQQRLSTCYLAILAIAHTAAKNGHANWAMEVAQTFLLLRPFSDNPYNTKLVPAFADRQQFKNIWDGFRSLPAFTAETVWPAQRQPSPPAPAGPASGPMLTQYNRLLRAFGRLFDEKGMPGLEGLLPILVSQLSFVQISLRDPTAAPKIFERLNARGERITTGDLVRNEVFARVVHDPNLAHAIFSNEWEPFVARFTEYGILLEALLFPYGLVFNPQTTKADLFTTLRRRWQDLPSPTAIIADMARFVPTIVALETGRTEGVEWGPQFVMQMKRLFHMRAPSSIYPFVLQLVEAVRCNEMAETEAVSVLAVLEGFLLRRAICGYEPTGLHAVFKGLWREISQSGPVSAAAVAAAIAAKPTVPWPRNAEFRDRILNGDLYNRKIVKFALREYELSREGETPADDFQIEHIAPRTPTPEWSAILGDQYGPLVNTWGNLIPLTPVMNPSVGQDGFASKCSDYQDSIFASAREVAAACTQWSASEILARGQRIADWAVTRWSDPRLD